MPKMRSLSQPVLVATLLLASLRAQAQAPPRAGHAYRVDCNANSSTIGILRSLNEANALKLEPHDSLLFARGTVCHGSLHPQGDGFSIAAFGNGALPRIQAGPSDEAALRLFNQQNIDISSLDIRGGSVSGISISGDTGTMHNLSLQNLTVSNVHGKLKQKESGLIVIRPTSSAATFDGVHLDSIRAFNTTQWSGIFIAGGSREHPVRFATVSNSVVHDVQGEGIVLFNAEDSSIRRSVAWHTGMQHQLTIGTPNAIWTWQCNRCLVEENEAFLTDSPGVDGGAFDIDWGNTLNTVRHNFAHETQGYCVSIFAANGPTRQSVVDGNLCMNNGLSPRLAQRQGAILLMTWNGGTIDGLSIMNNIVDWAAPGDTTVVQTGATVQASAVRMNANEIHTTGTMFVDPALTYTTTGDRYFLRNADGKDLAIARKLLTHETNATLTLEPFLSPLPTASTHTPGWRLVAHVPSGSAPSLFINLKTAAVEYLRSGLKLSLDADASVLQAAKDWGLEEDGIQLTIRPTKTLSLALISPAGKTVRTWSTAPAPIDLGLALRRWLGTPVYGRLPFENIRATD